MIAAFILGIICIFIACFLELYHLKECKKPTAWVAITFAYGVALLIGSIVLSSIHKGH